MLLSEVTRTKTQADILTACKWTSTTAYQATEVLDVAWQFHCKINPVIWERGVKNTFG